MPSFDPTPSQIVDFPAEMRVSPGMRVELSTLPQFGGLSQIYTSGIAFQWDSLSEIAAFAAYFHDDGIIQRQALSNTPAQRISDPTKRPVKCNACPQLINNTYLGMINFKRRFLTNLPRINFHYLKLPLVVTVGTNLKYLKDELEGYHYIGHNINMDAAASFQIIIPNPNNPSQYSRNITLQISGFELLQTSQISEFGKEKIGSRYHVNLYWNEKLRRFGSTLCFGLIHQPEWSNLPGIALSLNFRELVSIKAGYQGSYLSGGVNLKYKALSVHYAILNHTLGASPYQLAMQIHLETLKWFK